MSSLSDHAKSAGSGGCLQMPRGLSIIQIHETRARVHERAWHAPNVSFGSFVVGGHDREQFHEFFEQVDHAKVAIFGLNNPFTGCRDGAAGVQRFNEHFNARATFEHPSLLIGVEQGRQKGFVAILGCLFQKC